MMLITKAAYPAHLKQQKIYTLQAGESIPLKSTRSTSRRISYVHPITYFGKEVDYALGVSKDNRLHLVTPRGKLGPLNQRFTTASQTHTSWQVEDWMQDKIFRYGFQRFNRLPTLIGRQQKYFLKNVSSKDGPFKTMSLVNRTEGGCSVAVGHDGENIVAITNNSRRILKEIKRSYVGIGNLEVNHDCTQWRANLYAKKTWLVTQDNVYGPFDKSHQRRAWPWMYTSQWLRAYSVKKKLTIFHNEKVIKILQEGNYSLRVTPDRKRWGFIGTKKNVIINGRQVAAFPQAEIIYGLELSNRGSAWAAWYEKGNKVFLILNGKKIGPIEIHKTALTLHYRQRWVGMRTKKSSIIFLNASGTRYGYTTKVGKKLKFVINGRAINVAGTVYGPVLFAGNSWAARVYTGYDQVTLIVNGKTFGPFKAPPFFDKYQFDSPYPNNSVLRFRNFLHFNREGSSWVAEVTDANGSNIVIQDGRVLSKDVFLLSRFTNKERYLLAWFKIKDKDIYLQKMTF